MILFPGSKINLGLNIIRKRQDGFHDIETFFYPVPINDALEIIPMREKFASIPIQFSHTGLWIDGGDENNLCVRAYHLLKNDFPHLPSVKIHLHKAIPMGAGLGGGSSDGAFTLLLLNNNLQLGLTKEQLINYASQLGSDCPFFIINKPCFAKGRGEILDEHALDLQGFKLLIVNPVIHINTAWAFTQIIPKLPVKEISNIIAQPLESWKNELVNDFEEPVLEKYPELRTLKTLLYSNGAVYACMSGSGSTFFGIFQTSQKIPSNIFPPHYFIKETQLYSETK